MHPPSHLTCNLPIASPSQLLRRGGAGCGPRLRTLKLRSCDKAVTDALLAAFLPRAASLRTLDLGYCVALTGTCGCYS